MAICGSCWGNTCNFFNQSSLSPDRKHVAAISENLNELVLFNTEQLITKTIAKGGYEVIGWNQNSTKLLFTSYNGKDMNEVKVYDLKTGNISTVAKLLQLPKKLEGVATIIDIR